MARFDSVNALFVTEYLTSGSALSSRRCARPAVTVLIMGWSDPGSTIPLRDRAWSGFFLSIYGVLCFGFILAPSVVNFLSAGNEVPLRSYARLGLPLLISDSQQIGFTFAIRSYTRFGVGMSMPGMS